MKEYKIGDLFGNVYIVGVYYSYNQKASFVLVLDENGWEYETGTEKQWTHPFDVQFCLSLKDGDRVRWILLSKEDKVVFTNNHSPLNEVVEKINEELNGYS